MQSIYVAAARRSNVAILYTSESVVVHQASVALVAASDAICVLCVLTELETSNVNTNLRESVRSLSTQLLYDAPKV